ncbi:MAG: leucine-rich repeat domain-containing protein [Candidatus Hydrogenedentota bacterium]
MKLSLAGVVCALVFSLAGCPCLFGRVQIQDAALESVIRSQLNIPFGCISERDLLKITELHATDLNIRRLDGMEHMRNLTTLNLKNNVIQSITPLTNLTNLRFLDLGFNEISNLEPLAGLFLLDELYLDGNEIFNLSPLVTNSVNGGLGAGDTVVLPSTLRDSDDQIKDNFLEDIKSLEDKGVDVVVEQAGSGTSDTE